MVLRNRHHLGPETLSSLGLLKKTQRRKAPLPQKHSLRSEVASLPAGAGMGPGLPPFEGHRSQPAMVATKTPLSRGTAPGRGGGFGAAPPLPPPWARKL